MPLNNPATTNVNASSATPTTIASSTTSAVLLAANAARKGATFWNSSTAILYLELGATATATAWTVKLSPDGYYELPFGYTGVISGIWSAANGSCFVRELT